MDLDPLRYPLGLFQPPAEITSRCVHRWIDDIERFPGDLLSVVEPLTPRQLDTRYRPEGWRVRQVVHHLADSHLNSFVRFKWALTEDRPTIKAYHEERWAELSDSSSGPVALSLNLLEALHERWVVLLRGLDATTLRKEFVHPDSGPVRLDVNIGTYSWHGRHHLAHITRLGEREGWTSP